MAIEELGKQTFETKPEIQSSFGEMGKRFKNIDTKTWGFLELQENSERYSISGNKTERLRISIEIQEALKQTQCELLPRNGGEWSGEAGDSEWKPTPNEIPKKNNEERKTWEEILEPYGKEGIEFKDGEPDFTSFAKATVEIDAFSDNRNEVFIQADEALAKQWTEEGKDGKEWTAQDVKAYRKEHNLTWHERSDMKTLDLVPQEIHGNISHSGGHSESIKQTRGAA